MTAAGLNERPQLPDSCLPNSFYAACGPPIFFRRCAATRHRAPASLAAAGCTPWQLACEGCRCAGAAVLAASPQTLPSPQLSSDPLSACTIDGVSPRAGPSALCKLTSQLLAQPAGVGARLGGARLFRWAGWTLFVWSKLCARPEGEKALVKGGRLRGGCSCAQGGGARRSGRAEATSWMATD